MKQSKTLKNKPVNTMNILCATDKNFLNPTYVTIQSVIANHPQIHCVFYVVVSDDVTDEDKAKLMTFVTSSGNEVHFLNSDSYSYDQFVVCERFNKVAYFRLMAHQFLPKNMDRVLYLDVDIVVDANIYDDFYCLDFGDNYLIATSHNPNPDYFNAMDKTLVNLEAAAKGEYFNSGVLLMNLDKFRKNITYDKYNAAYESCVKRGIEVFYDQGLLNYMFFDKTIYLSSMDYNYRFSIPKDYAKRLVRNRTYKKAIIHFTGMKQPYKPWDLRFEEEDLKCFPNVPYKNNYFYVSKELNDLMEIWWKYAVQTPVYDEINKEMLIKRKWFRRNIRDFAVKHNETVANLEKTSPQTVVKTNTVVKKEVQYPEGFHYKTYKIISKLLTPLYAIKRRIKRRKKTK